MRPSRLWALLLSTVVTSHRRLSSSALPRGAAPVTRGGSEAASGRICAGGLAAAGDMLTDLLAELGTVPARNVDRVGVEDCSVPDTGCDVPAGSPAASSRIVSDAEAVRSTAVSIVTLPFLASGGDVRVPRDDSERGLNADGR